MQSEHVYNGLQIWSDYDSAGNVTARYLAGQGQDELVARWTPNLGTAWYLTDKQGTVRDLANSQGKIFDHIDYSVLALPWRKPTPG